MLRCAAGAGKPDEPSLSRKSSPVNKPDAAKRVPLTGCVVAPPVRRACCANGNFSTPPRVPHASNISKFDWFRGFRMTLSKFLIETICLFSLRG
ncbi:unnamed protein product [Ixodes persulcatus]